MNALQTLSFLATLFFLGCVTAGPSETLPIRTVAKGAFSGLTEAKEQIIKNQKEWQEVWPKLSARLRDGAKVPEVDFAKEMLVLVSMGEQRTGGYNIEISKVEISEDKLKVHVNRREPASGGFNLQVLTAPFHVVAVPKNNLKAQFLKMKSATK